MFVRVLNECGYDEAMAGLALSYNRGIDEMPAVALKLCGLDRGHNKFLESVIVWFLVQAPRDWWQQFDTYRVGVTKQSQSTMHTLMQRDLTQSDFERPIYAATLERLNELRRSGDFVQLKTELPEGFLQTRVVCANYKSLRNIILQRESHKLAEWHQFIADVKAGVAHPELLP